MKKLSTVIYAAIVIGVYAWLLVRLFTDPIEAQAKEAYISDTYLDEEIIEDIEKIAPQYGISIELIEALVESESSGDPYALSITGKHYGLCQVSYTGHKDIMDELDIDRPEMLYDPVMNLHAACKYLDSLREDYGDIFTALSHYNGHKSPKNNAYVKKIINRAYELEEVHGLHDYRLNHKFYVMADSAHTPYGWHP